MRNIWKIFKMDMKGLVKNVLALIIAIGLCFLPALYAWFNIYSNWDPYANTSNIKIAVATEDEGFTQEDGTFVNMGDEVIAELKENTSIGWTVVDTTEEAEEGVYSGDYYAAVVIDSDFSYSMYNALLTDFDSNPTITYYENEKKNAVATKITDTAVSTLKQSINKQFIEVVAETVFTETNALATELESEGAMEQFEAKLVDLDTSLASYSDMITAFIEGNDALTDAVDEVNDQIPGLSSSIQQGASSLDTADQNLEKTQASLNDFSTQVSETLTTISNSMSAISTDISNANLSEDAQNTATAVGQAATDTATLVTQLNDLEETISSTVSGSENEEEAQKAVQDVIDTLNSLSSGAEDIQGTLDSIIAQTGTTSSTSDSTTTSDQLQAEAQEAINEAIADSVTTATDSINASLQSCSESIANMQSMYTNSLVPEMNNVISSMSEVLTNVSTILEDISDTMGDMTLVLSGVETTVMGANTSLEQVQEVIESVRGKLDTIIEKLDAVNDDEKVQTLLEVLQGDPESYGEYFSEPVDIVTEEVYPIENYGSAMTPFYSVLALWVGATILVALIKAKAEPKGLTNVKSYQLYFGRYLLFYVMGQLQAAIIVLGDIYLLHCQILYPGLFWLVASLASFTFTLFIYSLTISFGDVGKALAVVIMVIQIAGSGGTYPIELLPSVFRNIYIFFPFPYAINAMRETIGGMYGSTYVSSLLELMIFVAVSLAIGLVIRIPFVGINHFVERRMEDTKMM